MYKFSNSNIVFKLVNYKMYKGYDKESLEGSFSTQITIIFICIVAKLTFMYSHSNMQLS